MEPAMTNVGIVLPNSGYLDEVQRLAKQYGTYLIFDETHTISYGPGGMTGGLGLRPDFLTIGKAIGGGIPTGTFGMTHDLAAKIQEFVKLDLIDTGGIGGTLAGNALSLAAMRATLTEVLTEAAYARMIPLADLWADGLEEVIREYALSWHVNRLGARAEYTFTPRAPRTGREAADAGDFELEQYLHLHLLNEGFLLTPFHNMALISPATTREDIDAHTRAFRNMCRELVQK
jgi:glutamate-1-semialdehyde 2,1-aminomutase